MNIIILYKTYIFILTFATDRGSEFVFASEAEYREDGSRRLASTTAIPCVPGRKDHWRMFICFSEKSVRIKLIFMHQD